MSQTCVNESLIEECQGLVRSLAATIRRRLPPHVPLDDLIAYGQLGLVEAARDFDDTRGNRFSTYAYYRIRGAIYDGVAKMNWGSRAQYQQARYDQMAGEVLSEQAAENDCLPTSLSTEGAGRWFRDLSHTLAAVYVVTRVACGGDRPEDQLAGRSQPSPMVEIMDREIRVRLNESIDALPADEAALIRATYFEGVTLQQAGERLGISKSWASRLHAKALQRLARSLRLLGVAT